MNVLASCHCGAVQQSLQIRNSSPSASDVSKNDPVGISLCHCSSCRHTTGLLFTSYLPITEPQTLSGTSFHGTVPGQTRRYFCILCGCHFFRSRFSYGGEARAGDEGEVYWEVATGVLNNVADIAWIKQHLHVSETRDGGASVWIKAQNGHAVAVYQGNGPGSASEESLQKLLSHRGPPVTVSERSSDGNHIQASCQCGTVRFHVTRPDASSKLPKSPFPDLMIPYHTHHPTIPNPEHKTWWLRENDTKYLAGTCACRSCRLTSGFEIQTWAFIPRSNIYFHVTPDNNKGVEEKAVEMPLDFGKLPASILQSYESSPGVLREFCGRCGATVFWHDKWRPELVDVSVGLFCAKEGARAESYLHWWTERISFAEDAENDRDAKSPDNHFDLIPQLERGLKIWGEEKYHE